MFFWEFFIFKILVLKWDIVILYMYILFDIIYNENFII